VTYQKVASCPFFGFGVKKRKAKRLGIFLRQINE
jgi:hypothetical protein